MMASLDMELKLCFLIGAMRLFSSIKYNYNSQKSTNTVKHKKKAKTCCNLFGVTCWKVFPIKSQ